MATFSTWRKAYSYYKICFTSGVVHICENQAVHTPIHSLAHKKQKFHDALAVPTQPYFTPGMGLNISLSSPSLSLGQHLPLLFPESPAVAKLANNLMQMLKYRKVTRPGIEPRTLAFQKRSGQNHCSAKPLSCIYWQWCLPFVFFKLEIMSSILYF